MTRVLPALLVLATALFLVGAVAERSGTHRREPGASEAPATHAGEPGEAAERPHHERGRESERLLGVDLESTPLLVLAVLAGGALALLAAGSLSRDARAVMLVAVAAFAWAALDVRELVHQLDESRGGIAALAGGVALLHVSAAALAAHAARPGYARSVRSSEVSAR